MRMWTGWTEMAICPMCRRPMFEDETHTRTVTLAKVYTPAELERFAQWGILPGDCRSSRSAAWLKEQGEK